MEITVQDIGLGITSKRLKELNNEGNSLTGNSLRSIRHRMEALSGESVFEN